jgi:hypothetical protein
MNSCLRQARGLLFSPLLLREASKRVPIFDRGTGSKPERLRSSSLQAGLSLIVLSDPPARVSVQAPRFFVIYDSHTVTIPARQLEIRLSFCGSIM